MKIPTHFTSIAVVLLLMTGCVSTPHAEVFEGGSAVQLRSYQSRIFDTTDRERTLRTIIAALQDLGFVIDKADATLGSITATKLDDYRLRVTATIRPRGTSQTIVRVNATHDNAAIEDPGPYQDFYVVLEKAMFLTAHNVD